MRSIEVKILNPDAVDDARQMMAFTARLTQRGHEIQNMDDLQTLYEKPASGNLIMSLSSLPHPTIQKFGVINVAVVGASRRFLAQITRHQNEVKFMSASLQYSDYSDSNSFCVPYEILERGQDSVDAYLATCQQAMRDYKYFAEFAGNDAAGYLAPQGLRNILIISATPYQWIHMIRQRSCRRNTKETQYVMLKVWEQLYEISPEWFGECGPFCTRGRCEEGKMACRRPIKRTSTPTDILKEDFPLIYGGENND